MPKLCLCTGDALRSSQGDGHGFSFIALAAVVVRLPLVDGRVAVALPP
jgi:hypothetical protein